MDGILSSTSWGCCSIVIYPKISPITSTEERDTGNKNFDYARISDREAEEARIDLVQTKGFFILPRELF